jgi:hypothetical protein
MPLDGTWRKSTRSSTNGACVEVRLWHGTVQIRDTKLGPASPILTVTSARWAPFVRTVAAGQP